MNRSFRKIVSVVTLAAVLMVQLAVSAYACPMLLGAAADQMQTPDQSTTPAYAEPDTVDMDSAQPGLCQLHCSSDQKIVNDLPFDPATVAFVPAFAVDFPALEPTSSQSIAAFPSLHHATSPPLAVRHCCFRI